MSNAVAIISKKKEVLAAALAASKSFAGSSKRYLKFNANSGTYSHGKDDTILPNGSELAINMDQFQLGWICWKDEKVVEEIMVKVMEGKYPPKEHELTDHMITDPQEGWRRQAAIEGVILDDVAAGEIEFKVATFSGVPVLTKLLEQYIEGIQLHGEDAVPIITLDSEGFMPKEKKYGKKYAPVISIVEWTTAEKLASLTASSEAPENYEAPKEAAPTVVETPPPVEATASPGSRRKRF